MSSQPPKQIVISARSLETRPMDTNGGQDCRAPRSSSQSFAGDSGACRELFKDYEEPSLLLKIQRAYEAIHSNSKSIRPSERNPI